MKVPQKGETFHEVYKRAPLSVKKELDSLKKDCKEYFRAIDRQTLIDEIETDKKHHHLMRLCANAFADTDLSKQSGYKFYFTEPLIELISTTKKKSLFDIFLYNEKENRGIFIECKSSVGDNHKAQDTLKQIGKSKDFIIEKIQYFSECLGVELDPTRFEYVSCIYVEDSAKFFQSIEAQGIKARKKYDTNLVKFWVYIDHNKSIKLHHHHSHASKNLTDLLLQGFQLENLHTLSRYDLSFYLNMHPFRFIRNAIIGYCYDQNLHNSVTDPKIIKKRDIIEYVKRKIPLNASDEDKESMITKKVEEILNYGEKYDLLEILSDDEIKIKSVGVQLTVVKKHLQTKYIENWIEEKSEERCKKRALENFVEKYYPAHYRRLDFFDPNITP
jgi:hypothetical protein